MSAAEATAPGPAAADDRVLWRLMGHELRLWGRRVSDAGRRWGRLLPLVVLLVAVLLYGFGWITARALSRVPERVSEGLLLPLAGAGVVTLWSLLLAQALTAATRAFFETGPLDLIHTAPIPAGRVFAVRSLALAVITAGPFALFILPVAHMGVAIGGPGWLAIYPILVALALAATAAGMGLALVLVRVIGPRLTRSLGQVLAVLIGTGLGIAIQAFNRLSTDDKITFLRSVSEDAGHAQSLAGRLASALGRAATGDVSALSVIVLVAVALFMAAVAVLGPSFGAARAMAAGAAAGPRPTLRADRPAGRATFGSGLVASLRRKELRLLTRDPWVLMPVLQRSIALVPTCLALAGLDRTGDLVLALTAPLLVVFAGKLAGGLAWLTLAAEEAPELVATAPVAPAQVARAKVEAALLAMAVLFTAPLVLLSFRDPAVAAATAVGCIAATGSATLLALAEPRRNTRRDFGDRFRNAAGFAVSELVVTLSWAAAVWLAVQGRPVGATLAAMAAGGGLIAAVRLLRGPRA